MSTWQLIETALLVDREQILVWCPKAFGKGYRFLARWNPDKYSQKPRPFWDLVGQQITTSRANQPTHWMPLPEPPTGERADD